MSEVFDLRKFDEYKEDNRREVKKAENSDGSQRTTGLTDERKLKKDFWDIVNNKAKVSANILVDQDVNTYTDEKTGHEDH